MTSVSMRKDDQMLMTLVHYFVTKENYAPIGVQGVKDEIWLENLDGPYRIIRINTNTIINEEQYKFDIFKMKHIMKQIKKKTLSLNVNALNICFDLSKKIDANVDNNINTIRVTSLKDVKKDPSIKEAFPEIDKELLETSNSLELLINATNDINKKTNEENKKFSKVFAPKKIIFTNLIILVCLIMYMVVSVYGGNFLSFQASVLALFGGNNLMLVKSGEVWRLFTDAFLHAGLIHLLVNMYSLAIIGTQVETFIGKWKLVFIYIISTVCASLMSLVFMESNIVSVGASGAIFGLMGALLYFGYHYRLYLSDAIKHQIIPIVLLNLMIGFAISGIDNAAHIGGLIGGYLAAMAVGITDKSTKRNMINGIVVLLLYIIFLSYVVFMVR